MTRVSDLHMQLLNNTDGKTTEQIELDQVELELMIDEQRTAQIMAQYTDNDW